MERSDQGRARLVVARVLFVMLVAAQVVRDPGRAAVTLAVMAVVAGAVVVAVGWFRRRVVPRVPTRYSESPSRTVRVGTRVATGYATCLVGFYVAIAVLGLFTLLQALF
jgi:hypothetical protein